MNRQKLVRFAPLAVLLCAVFALPAASTQAYVLSGLTWPGGHHSYRINVSSFQNNLGGLSLNQAQTEYWVPYAFSMWKERTGANLTFTYSGTTTNTPDCVTPNGVSEVHVVPGCKPYDPSCGVWATNKRFYSGSDMTESDICIWGGSATWRVITSGFPITSKDLIGTLVHEIGHGLGLQHSPFSVMEGMGTTGHILSRYPYGDDIAGMRAMYPPVPYDQRRWRVMNGTYWSSEIAIAGATEMHSMAAIGPDIVVTALGLAGDRLHFTRTAYPPSASSTWVNRFVLDDSWRPPSVASRTSAYSELWVAAWSLAQTNSSFCPGIRVIRSLDAFDTGSLYTLTASMCGTMHEPALTFDPVSGRFVLFFVRRELPQSFPGGTAHLNGRIYARTSLDGISWTSPQDTGIYTNDAVDLACRNSAPSSCLMTYVRASINDPYLLNRTFSVNASGSISIGTWNQNSAMSQRTPSVAARTYGGTNEWSIGIPWTSSETNASNGLWNIYSARDTDTPINSYGWGFVQSIEHRATLAASPDLSSMYMVYVR